MAKIKFLKGANAGEESSVPKEGLIIGRGGSCDIQIPDTMISEEHVQIRQDKGLWWLYDLQSSNGTTVNGKRSEAARLREGDRIGLGGTLFDFSVNGASKSAGSPSARKDGSSSSEKSLSGSSTSRIRPKGSATQSLIASPGAKPVRRPSDSQKLNEADAETVRELNVAYGRMREMIGRVIIGQDQVVEELLIAIFCRGHALLMGVPGLAKTLLVSTLSEVLDLSYKRIQFTPDLMPSDITGTEVLEEDAVTGKRHFRFVHGPLFANLVLADEINRTPPKTQASLLEAMQEHQVTVGEETFHLPEPFFVLATQNPIEQEGTYPLPEAQLDRFMFNILVDYPSAVEEQAIIKQVTGTYEADLDVVMTAEHVMKLQQIVRRVPVADHVVEFASNLARVSRPKKEDAPDFVKEMVAWGAGPRAGIYLITAAKARAILKGRYHTTTEDVQKVALPVLRHRVLTTFNAEAAGVTSDDIIRMLIKYVEPRADLDI